MTGFSGSSGGNLIPSTILRMGLLVRCVVTEGVMFQDF